MLVAEYGGVGFDAGGPFDLNDTKKFLTGYSQRGCGLPSTGDEAVLRIEGLTAEIYKREFYAGFCYTQLYDVEFEKNGLPGLAMLNGIDVVVVSSPASREFIFIRL